MQILMGGWESRVDLREKANSGRSYDLVILDYGMTGINGMDVA